ncbi:hypothetical protein BDY19DRAFT_899436 [Irpex rosettiformis]|uniref:Uncharacterized protein n=1 Tax=Irpex rosettiformis TaxID=378272 RepID=A0ACB8TPM7_9APHY|nr:hypothetical protein BDY19DRAFT_899436 [Irpex rosettiformis]
MPCGILGRSRVVKIRIPPEVVDHIVSFVLSEHRCFEAVASLSLTCHSYREIAFRRFFCTLSVNKKKKWTHFCQIPGMFQWVRSLDITTSAISAAPQILQRFSRLTALRVDFSTEGLHTHEDYVKLILSNLHTSANLILTPATKAKKLALPHILTLEFCFLPSITPHILSMVSIYCPKLEELVLKCTDRLLPDCCWTCYEEVASCTTHSPLPDVICDVGDLTRAYGKALSPLAPTLVHLHLGIYLSSVDLFYDHIEHASLPPFPPLPFAFLDNRPYSPSFCDECQTEGYLVEEVRKTELVASAQMKLWLPMLENVCWSTWFKRGGDGSCPCTGAERDHETAACWIRWANDSGAGDAGGEEREVEVARMPWPAKVE